MSKTTLERAQQAMEELGDTALLIALAQAEQLARIADAIEKHCERLDRKDAEIERLSQELEYIRDVFADYVAGQAGHERDTD